MNRLLSVLVASMVALAAANSFGADKTGETKKSPAGGKEGVTGFGGQSTLTTSTSQQRGPASGKPKQKAKATEKK